MTVSAFASFIIAFAGLIVLVYRLEPWKKAQLFSAPTHEPKVSIIVPCRNEAANLPNLLRSLEELRYRNFEILIVDDHSEDETRAVAFGAKNRFENFQVISAPERPAGWGGKNWACHSAVAFATGDLLLFTDADTTHLPDSLTKAVSYLNQKSVGLISAPPFHRCGRAWEKTLGSFQVLPLIAGAYRQPPTDTRLFAIGQYLLFTRESYEALHGHRAVRDSLAEDFDLAQIWVRSRFGYGVFPSAQIFEVQMYDSFPNFAQGWKRLLRLGLKRSQLQATIEIALCLNVLGFCLFSKGPGLFWIGLAGFPILAVTQRRLGRFSILGALLAPLGAWLFCALSLWALAESATRTSFKWRGREYEV